MFKEKVCFKWLLSIWISKILLCSFFHGRFCVCYRLLKCQCHRCFWTLYGMCCSEKMLLLFIVLLRELLTFLLFPYYFRNVGTLLCVIYFLFQCLFILQWKTQGNYEGIFKRIWYLLNELPLEKYYIICTGKVIYRYTKKINSFSLQMYFLNTTSKTLLSVFLKVIVLMLSLKYIGSVTFHMWCRPRPYISRFHCNKKVGLVLWCFSITFVLSFNFGSADSEIFGVPIPIMAVVSENVFLLKSVYLYLYSFYLALI